MGFERLKINTIRTKLVVSLITICVIPLVITGVASYNRSKTILNDKLTLTSTQTLAEVNTGLKDYFHGFSNTVAMTSSNPAIENVDTDNNADAILDIIKSVKDSDKDILDIYYGTASGKFFIYPDAKMPDGYDATQRGWYKLALENKGKVVITPAYEDAGTKSNVVGIAKTVEKDGKVVGVIGVDCTLSTLAERISEKKIGNTGYMFISELSGKVLAHPNKDVVNTDDAAKLNIWDKIKSEKSGFVNYQYDGKNKFGVYDTNDLTGWKIVATLDESELTNDTKSILQTNLIMILVMTLITVFMAFILSNGIVYNIRKLKEVFAKASNGDLTVSMKASTKDEFSDLANSFNSMISNISELMKSVSNSSNTVLETSTSLASMSEEITASINEVAKAIEDVSSGATDQVQNAQQGASEMEDLSKRLDKINVNSNEMDKISNSTKTLGSKGLYMIETLTEKSSKTKTATSQVNEIVQDMNESTKQINAISETIANITAQTNLLSLNASIESARAGEAGKGFAVVAEEIRKLAEQSQASTEEIKSIIANIQKKSDTAVESIKLTETVVNEQDLAVSETQQIFSEILKSIEIMITKVEEVRIAIVDINEKKKSTVSEIENISLISEQTASASEEVTASAEEITATMEELTKHSGELQKLAEKLGNEINKFKIN
ncbi:methyl-accepting chemotaxis protein McpC [Clostridium puniceum]|uniref:Methyl-accepting chemotaxis protein McpC n=1 Tax=Clostridium puniceum TaxID=29367 RepID=A0A1S8T7X4_9CLOT|nr:methyl-accepting chemotaxis protein [Clostridium puniceum]OOM73843.1 methyl-accepting chemotaxis protein McpC [Clostridium puniceum]